MLYSVAYIVALILCAALGRGLAALLGVTSAGGSVPLVAVVVGAVLLMGAGIVFEYRLLWARFQQRDAGIPAFIGRSRGTLLTSAAPPPIALGLTLGILSALMG